MNGLEKAAALWAESSDFEAIFIAADGTVYITDGLKEDFSLLSSGDGSFHMNLNEGCTAVSYELPIITVIFDNQVLGMVRQWQTSFYGKRYSNTDPQRRTDFVKLAEAFGAKGCRGNVLFDKIFCMFNPLLRAENYNLFEIRNSKKFLYRVNNDRLKART